MTELLNPKAVAFPLLFCEIFRLSIAHGVAHQVVHWYFSTSDFGIGIELLSLRTSENTNYAPISCPEFYNAYSNTAQVLSTHIWAHLSTSEVAHTSTPTTRGQMEVGFLSEEYVRAGVLV